MPTKVPITQFVNLRDWVGFPRRGHIWAPCEFWQTTLDWDSVNTEGLFGIAQILQRALGG